MLFRSPVIHSPTCAAGSTTGLPPALPLQPVKKVQMQAQEKQIKTAVGNGTGGVAAAAATLEKPKEKRISTMTEVQIMEKLRQVVSEDDPKLLYSKIEKVEEVELSLFAIFGANLFFLSTVPKRRIPNTNLQNPSRTEAVLLKHIPDPSFNNELPTPTPTLQKKAHMNFLIRNLIHGFPTRYTSQDASQPWLMFWTVQSFGILQVALDPDTKQK